ncbi:MAG: hypothetical protein EBU70_07300, partial [Actinobacteria bacterium]|nr:hypothetical protein [Actinomycetota bacterium]
MATVSEKPADLAVPEWRESSVVDEKVDRYLAARLRAVGADYKSVALTTFLLAAGVGLMAWLTLGVLADHWIVPGGLGRGSRLAWLVVGGVALLAAIVRWVAPLIRYRVNLVYAARTIERANPGLHNDVVNTVLARARPDRSPPVVLASLEHRAAKRLSK